VPGGRWCAQEHRMSEPPLARPPAVLKCSFCDKPHNEVARLIAGPHGVAICDEYVDVCRDILSADRAARARPVDAVLARLDRAACPGAAVHPQSANPRGVVISRAGTWWWRLEALRRADCRGET
jgi:hypothetical protein